MFNVPVFHQALLFLACVLVMVFGVLTFLWHNWLPVQLCGLLVAIVALAAAVGVVCA